VFTGWTLWSHVVRRADRAAALGAFRRAAPGAPVLLSFWRRARAFDPEEAADAPDPERRWQRLVRSVARRLRRGAVLEVGTIWSEGMFMHLVSERELTDEANSSGFAVAHYERDGSRFPHAVLIPARP
jgi:hypothetical protein